MQTLERRVTALELSNPLDFDRVLFIVFRAPGLPDTEIHKLSSADGVEGCQQWVRHPGESEHEFRARATREVVRSAYGTALLFVTG